MEGARRRLTLSDQMSVLNASNLRDLLRVRDDDNGRESLSGLTLGAVLSCPKRSTPVQVSRTLMEIIRDEETGASYRGLVDQNNKKSWKSFKDRLRLRRASAVCSSSSTTHPGSGIDECRIQISPPFPNNPPTGNSNIAGASTPGGIQPASSSETQYNTDSSSTGVNEPVITRLSAALEAEREQQRPEEGLSSSVAVVEEVAPVRMSLMALLEETDRQAGMVGSTYMGTVDEEEEEEGEGGGEEDGGQYTCCVCMVRHKGSAFIPCGHTFCRLCSRELWVSRGNCPLCNGFILEILDIF